MVCKKVTDGVYFIDIPDIDLRILCGCPMDTVKLLKKSGYVEVVERKGVKFELGPNAILLSDLSIQNGDFCNLAEFPVLHMMYMQGMVIPNHPGNTGAKPLLIGSEKQVIAQSEYIARGNYGLTTYDELLSAGISEEEAEKLWRLKLRFNFGSIQTTSTLFDIKVVETKPMELKEGCFIERKEINLFAISYKGETLEVDLNLKADEKYGLTYHLPHQTFRRNQFSVVHMGEGNGWTADTPCMSSLLVYKKKLYLIDAGPGISHILNHLGLTVNDLDGIFQTHCHDDHFAGLTSLMHIDHKIPYYTTQMVKDTIKKKLAALIGLNRGLLRKTFDFQILPQDRWSDIDGLRVLPCFSPHPVETVIYYFRAEDSEGKSHTYAHLADIISKRILGQYITDDPNKSGIEEEMYTQVWETYHMKADVKKIDAGGGLIHGDIMDFKDDPSPVKYFSHSGRPLTEEEDKHFRIARFGEQNNLIGEEEDFLEELTRKVIDSYPLDADSFMAEVACKGEYKGFKEHQEILPQGKVPEKLYLLLTGKAQVRNPYFPIDRLFYCGSFLGLHYFLNHKKPADSFKTRTQCLMLEISADIFLEYLKKHGLEETYIRIDSLNDSLKKCSLFDSRIPFHFMHPFMDKVKEASFPKGALLPKDRNFIYLIKSGKVSLNYKGRSILEVNPGEIFFEESLLHRFYYFTVEVLEDLRVIKLPSAELEMVPILQLKLAELYNKRLVEI